MLTDEVRYQLLKLLDANPATNQRDIARRLGISLGKANYCLKSLVHRGCVKATNFRDSRHKGGYIYLLTPRGIEEKGLVAARFLRQKIAEYERLREDIDRIRSEVGRPGRR